jgi:hypothetical protein
MVLYDCHVEKRDGTYQQGAGHKVQLTCKINSPNFDAFASCLS